MSPKPSSASAAGFLPLQRQTLSDLTLDAVRRRILAGVYREGEPLRQDSLADDLGVSRIPIREALRELEAEGLVTFSPHRGAIVSSLSLAEIDEIFTLRADVEARLLREAIPHLTAEHLALVDDVLDRYERAFLDNDVATWGELNWQFHAALYAPADRPVTMKIVQRLHRQCDRYSRMQLALTHSESRAHEEHRSIAAASREGNVPLACRRLRDHISGSGRSLVTFLREHRRAAVVTSRRRSKRA